MIVYFVGGLCRATSFQVFRDPGAAVKVATAVLALILKRKFGVAEGSELLEDAVKSAARGDISELQRIVHRAVRRYPRRAFRC